MVTDEFLELMSDLLDKAVQMPFSGKKSLVEVDKMRELIEEYRMNIPKEIREAKNIVRDRKVIITDARAEADTIIRKAEEKAQALISNQEITRQAQNKANEIMVTAQQKSKELRVTTNEYVDNMLNRVEDLLSHDLVDIKKARTALKKGI